MSGEHTTRQPQPGIRSLSPGLPWQSLAHPDHQPDDLTRLLKLLRVLVTDLQILKIETQMIPVIKPVGFKGLTLDALRETFEWLLTNSSWRERLRHPELCAAISDPESRRLLKELARNVVCVQTLLEDVQTKLKNCSLRQHDLESFCARLSEAEALALELGEFPSHRQDLRHQIEAAERRLDKMQGIGNFFRVISERTGAPLAVDSRQGARMLHALECIEKIPAAIRPWRKEHILDPARRINLQTWKVKARSILEMRKRVEAHFQVPQQLREASPSANLLCQLGESLRAEGLFAHFRASYTQALKAYRALLRDKSARKLDAKESDFQRAERLVEWVAYLEQAEIFERNPEAAEAFAPLFRGIDTDFTGAIEASAWSQKIRDELLEADPECRDPEFDTALVQFVRYVDEEKMTIATQLFRSEQAHEIREQLKESRVAGSYFFADRSQHVEGRVLDLRRLETLLETVGLAPDVRLSQLKELSERTQEILFLVRALGNQPELKTRLKGFYAGPFTDLQALEAASAFVKQVKASRLPEALKNHLLTEVGPQSLSDSRQPVLRCRTALNLVRDHLVKLELLTLGRSKEQGIDAFSLDDLLEGIQNALKQPQLFMESVNQLRQHRNQSAGLTTESPETRGAERASPEAPVV